MGRVKKSLQFEDNVNYSALANTLRNSLSEKVAEIDSLHEKLDYQLMLNIIKQQHIEHLEKALATSIIKGTFPNEDD
jgi:hypothetical protein